VIGECPTGQSFLNAVVKQGSRGQLHESLRHAKISDFETPSWGHLVEKRSFVLKKQVTDFGEHSRCQTFYISNKSSKERVELFSSFVLHCKIAEMD
jgi:hypothetical protein